MERPVTRVGRKLDVRPDQLREWARRLVEREGGVAAAGVVEAPERELKDEASRRARSALRASCEMRG
jgi:hypothetical protein